MLAKHLSKHAAGLSKSQIALAISLALGTISTALWPSVASAEPNARVLKTLELTNSSPASVCLIMSGRNIVDGSYSNLSQNVKVSLNGQNTDVPVSVYENKLCVDKLDSGKSYNIELKQGLLFDNGTKLNETINHGVTISDSIAQIKLPYNIILPKNGSNDSFTVKTVNQPAFKLSIYRIPESALNGNSLSDFNDSNFSFYNANQFITQLGRPVYERIFDIANDKSVDIFEAKQALKKASDEGMALVSADGTTPEEALKAQIDEAKKARVLDDDRNKTQSTTIKLKDFVSNADHGVYMIVAADPRLDYTNGFSYDDIYNSSLPITLKMMIITDLGMTTYQSKDGILVNVRSITSAKALKNINLKLIASNGEVLTEAKTDGDGTAIFKKEFVTGTNALKPQRIIAEGNNDYYVQDLTDTPLYIEDNTGTKSTSDYEVYTYTDRGIYRPNETVHYTALLRNKNLKSLDLPLTLTIENSFGAELVSVLLNESSMGGYGYDFKIPAGTVNGRYTAKLYLGDRLLNDAAFTIGSYVPTQINTSFINTESIIPINTEFKLKTATKFNYGGNASNLSGSMRLMIRPDEQPVQAQANAANNPYLKDFHFGPDKNTYTKLTKTDFFSGLKSDAEGVITHTMTVQKGAYPKKVVATGSVFDTSGQEVSASKTFKVVYKDPLIGIRRLENTQNANTHAEFALCSYLQDGSTYPQDVKYYLFKEITDYNFVYENGAWRYVVFKSRNLVHQGTVKVDNQSLDTAQISTELSDGSYVIELESPKSSTTLSFVKGFSTSLNNQTPDRVAVFADQESYLPGQKAKLSFDSPFDGYANLAVGSEGIKDFRTFKVEQGHNEIDIAITEDLYPQGHALLSLFSPVKDNTLGIIRAVGLVDLNMNSDVHKLNVTTTAPEEIKPGSQVSIKVSAQKADGNDKANGSGDKPSGYARVTLVDNGILGLTKYKAPDPNKVFMQDRAYDINLFDPYSLLIRDPKQQGQGYGDGVDEMMARAAGALSLDTTSFKTVALASEIVPLDGNGEATVTFDVPKFSGSLKYMTVAWDETRTGASSEDLIVRDNAVANIGLPRYLNVGDTVSARLNLHNLKAKDTEFKVDISCEGSLKCSWQSVRSLKPGIREDNYFDISAISDGVGKINLTVINPDFNYTDSYPLAVTYPQLPMLKSFVAPVNATSNASVEIGPNNFNDITDVLINLSALPFVNPVALTSELDKGYDTSISGLAAELESKLMYGTTLVADETTQKAAEEAQSAEEVRKHSKPYANQEQLNNKIEEIVFRILARQRGNGSFHAWAPYEGLYATEVLIKASEAGFSVNPDALELAIKHIRTTSGSDNELAPYALAILSRFESINQADARQMLDEKNVKKPFLLAQLAVALNNIGDTERANSALTLAVEGLELWQRDYDQLMTQNNPFKGLSLEILAAIREHQVQGQYNLREVAFRVIGAALEIGNTELVTRIIEGMHSLYQAPDFIGATEASAKLKADYIVTDGNTAIKPQRATLSAAEIDSLLKSSQDQAQTTTTNVPKVEAKAAPTSNMSAPDSLYTVENGKIVINNTTNSNMFANVTVLGQYKHDKIISNKGFYTKVNLFNREGSAIDPDKYVFQPNEEILMEIFVDKKAASNDDMIVKTKIPAGFEFVRRMKHGDPAFGSLFNDSESYRLFDNISDFSTSDDTIAATYKKYDVDDSFSLFVVLRAAHSGKFTQGETIVQYKSDPGFYGTYMSDSTLNIAAPAK